MTPAKPKRLGALPPRYSFVLNPYPEERLSRCPYCEQKTGQRKLPLLIHVAPMQLIALNYTCRYCAACDLLIGHKHEIEYFLTKLFRRVDPSLIGNTYIIVGSVDKRAWQASMKTPWSQLEMLAQTSDFAHYHDELRLTRPGYYRVDQEPPIWQPPASQEWVKAGPGQPRQSKAD